MENDSPPSNLHQSEDSIHYSTRHFGNAENNQYKQSSNQKSALAQAKKKSEFLFNLITNLDTLIYVELCIIYYMDCSLFRLVLRLLNQMIFFTPKPAFVRPAPQQRPYIGAIFIPGLICILLHVFTARTEAGETMRGYLHGGVIIDLIGQKGPSSKIHLLLLDILLVILQCLMLAVLVEKDRLKTILSVLSISSNEVDNQIADLTTSTQDYDAEERGVVRNEISSDGDLELQHLNGSSSSSQNLRPITSIQNEKMIVETTSRQVQQDDDTLELFWSGMATISDFHILHTLRKQWQDYGIATGTALQTVGYSAEFTALTSNRRMNTATSRLQQGVNSNF